MVTNSSARDELIETAWKLEAGGLSAIGSTSGNLSRRVNGGLLITPTGLPYEAMMAGDLQAWSSTPNGGGQARTSFCRRASGASHRDIYRARPEAQAIVHAHPRFATRSLALSGAFDSGLPLHGGGRGRRRHPVRRVRDLRYRRALAQCARGARETVGPVCSRTMVSSHSGRLSQRRWRSRSRSRISRPSIARPCRSASRSFWTPPR